MRKCSCAKCKAENDVAGPLPHYEYDCGHCRFSWCCGPLCACAMAHKVPKAPLKRRRQVQQAQYRWRKAKGYVRPK
jgi:hypothetical protein